MVVDAVGDGIEVAVGDGLEVDVGVGVIVGVVVRVGVDVGVGVRVGVVVGVDVSSRTRVCFIPEFAAVMELAARACGLVSVAIAPMSESSKSMRDTIPTSTLSGVNLA
jgi:hypothetical protein